MSTDTDIDKVTGFNVANLQRMRIRKDITGEYKGYRWFIMGDGIHRFRWSFGPLGGFVQKDKARLLDAVHALQGAYRTISRLRNIFGDDAVKGAAADLETLLQWEQAAADGRIEISVKKASAADVTYLVKVRSRV